MITCVCSCPLCRTYVFKRCFFFPFFREGQIGRLEAEIKEMKNTLSQLQLERTELIAKV